MKKLLFAAGIVTLLGACGGQKAEEENPFFAERYNTPFEVPPFDKIRPEHYKPALLKGIEEHNAELKAIVENTEEPTFENTIVAFDESGQLLDKVSDVFFSQTGIESTEEMQAITTELSPLLTQHDDEVWMNEGLFARIKKVYEQKEQLGLDAEQQYLLEQIYRRFVRNGANLSKEEKAQLSKLNSEIDLLEVTFEHNMLKETNDYQLVIEKEEDLAGLPADLIANAATQAKEAGKEGKWVFTLHNPSIMPFLQYSQKRELREQLFKAYMSRGNHGGKADNREVVRKLITARLAKAKLLGFDNYAELALDNRMAKHAVKVYELLDRVWTPALAKAKEELADIQAEIKKEGYDFTAESWDWRYYAEKAKQARFNLDENELRPYLQLDHVRDGVFYVANRLYGVTFTKVKEIPLPHPQAEAFECKDKDGTSLGVIYFDYFPRATKEGGAWCGTYRRGGYKKGVRVPAVVTIVCNFTQPANGQPALLNVDETETLFHEFGHAMHDFLKLNHYEGTTSVERDFVELPSQLDEHWAFEPEVLKQYAKHYQTGEVIPMELVNKMEQCSEYGQGFATVEYVAASYLDMDFHTLTEVPADMDVMAFEAKTLGDRGLPAQIPSRYKTTYFSHTMGGGYTAGYYSYLWAEVLDADAFEAFKEKGDIFSQEVAGNYRKYILEKGGTEEGMQMYLNFRGKEPSIEPLLKNRGLK
jgi:peptidyl-dipeptidase Dcp